MIEIDDLGMTVHGATVFEDCTTTLATGTVTLVTGAPGSGKTILVRGIAQLERYSGSIRFDGDEASQIRDRLYVCLDDAPLVPYLNGYDSVRMLVGHAVTDDRIRSIAPAIADAALLKRTAYMLTLGQRKRVHLLAALCSGARYLILDDILSGMGAPTIEELAPALRELADGATVLLTGRPGEGLELLSPHRLDIASHRLIVQSPEVAPAPG